MRKKGAINKYRSFSFSLRSRYIYTHILYVRVEAIRLRLPDIYLSSFSFFSYVPGRRRRDGFAGVLPSPQLASRSSAADIYDGDGGGVTAARKPSIDFVSFLSLFFLLAAVQ